MIDHYSAVQSTREGLTQRREGAKRCQDKNRLRANAPRQAAGSLDYTANGTCPLSPLCAFAPLRKPFINRHNREDLSVASVPSCFAPVHAAPNTQHPATSNQQPAPVCAYPPKSRKFASNATFDGTSYTRRGRFSPKLVTILPVLVSAKACIGW